MFRFALLGILAIGVLTEGMAQTVGGTITGTVTDGSNGQRIARARVYLIRMTPSLLTTAPVTAANDGSFTFTPVSAGTFRVCAIEEPPFASNCLLPEGGTDTVTVNWGQTVTAAVRLRRGSKLSVRVNDPNGHSKRKVQGSSPSMVLLLSDVRGNVYPLSPSSRDASGDSYDVTIPTDTAVTLTARAFGLLVRDDANAVVGASGAGYGIQHSSVDAAAGRAQRAYVFNVVSPQ